MDRSALSHAIEHCEQVPQPMHDPHAVGIHRQIISSVGMYCRGMYTG